MVFKIQGWELGMLIKMRDYDKEPSDVKSMFSLKTHRRKNKRNVKLFEKKELFKQGEINLAFCTIEALSLGFF